MCGRGACRILVDSPEGKGLFRRPRHIWEENIKMDLQEVGWANMDWIDQFQDRGSFRLLVKAVAKCWVP